MPDSTLSLALQEAYAAAPSDVVVYHTLEINHPAFTQPIYVVRDNANLEADLEDGGGTVTFVRFAFDLVKPEVSTAGVPQCTVEFDNVSREILANIQLAMADTQPISITYREYLGDDLSTPQNDPPLTMSLSNIKADVFRVRSTSGFGDLNNRRFPTEEYTDGRFPGLVS